MRIDLAPFARGGKTSTAFSLSGDLSETVNASGCALREPVLAEGKLSYLGDGEYLAEGEIRAKLVFECARCLTDVDYEMGLPFSERFARSEEDDEHYAYTGESIDLSRMAAEQILMHLPMRVLCREDCRGLCGVCGANLNETDCECVVEAPNAFAGLKERMDALGHPDDKEV